MPFQRIQVIDSHTGGEPTRVVVAGGPDLGTGRLAERAQRFARDHLQFRRQVIGEPRGNDSIVGALLVPPANPDCQFGVIYFDNAEVLGMCGHGTIGLGITLAHLSRFLPGQVKLDTPAGIVDLILHDPNRVSLRNVPSFRKSKGVRVDVPDRGTVTGDIAFGGNWFFIASTTTPLNRDHLHGLADESWAIRRALIAQKVFGEGAKPIDHISLTGPAGDSANGGRHYVLCPSGSYDRSPCGTGTSARLACLAADGALKPGEIWKQESVTGSVFEASYERAGEDRIIPTITGTAFITAEATLLFDDKDDLS